MVTTETVPNSVPVSDFSASSSESTGLPLPRVEKGLAESCSDIPKVPGEVGGESFVVDKKHVSFGNCELRLYPVMLGDHPDCASGPPVSHGQAIRSCCTFQSALTFQLQCYRSLLGGIRSVAQLLLLMSTSLRVLPEGIPMT